MIDVFITFGQTHTHSVNGITFDKDCVAHLRAETHEAGREKAFEVFGGQFHNCTTDLPDMSYFPRGVIMVP